MQRALTGRFRVGEWLVDPAVDELRRGGEVVKLEPRVMRLLVHLAEREGQTVSAEQLLDAVWSGVVVSPQSVYTSIAQLRRALEGGDDEPRYVVTVPRRGYRLVAPVEPAPDADRAEPFGRWAGPPESVDPPADLELPELQDVNELERRVAPPEPSVPRPRTGLTLPGARRPLLAHPVPSTAPLTARRRWQLAGAAVAIALLAIAAAVLPRLLDRGNGAGDAPVVAVLPLAQLGAAAPDGLAEGLAEELLNGLAAVPGVRVAARGSTFPLRDADPREIGRRVGATHVVQGTLRRDAERLRVAVQLVDAATGYTQWSSTFDRPATDLLDVQRELSNAVVAAIAPRFAARAQEQTSARLASDSNAFAAYLEGRRESARRTPEAFARATALFQKSATLDPGFALAQVALAELAMLRFYYDNLPLEAAGAIAEPAIARALELDRLLPEAYAARGLLRTEQWRLEDAEQDLRRALVLNPNYVDAYVRLGTALEYQGRPRDALASLQKAAELDPLHFILHVRRCLALQNLGRLDDARGACERAIELQPNLPNGYWARGLIGLSNGHLDDAIADYRRALDAAPQRYDLRLQLAWLYLDVGRLPQARTEFETAVAARPDDPEVAIEAARYALATGDDAALATAVNRAAEAPTATPETLVDAALLALVLGDTPRAVRAVERARALPGYDESQLYGLWLARWGRLPPLALVLVDRARGDEAAARRRLDALERFVRGLQANGQAWSGLDYLAASVAALRGDRRTAFARLDAALAHDWQRAWWPRRDPSLAPLRADPRFQSWLGRVEQSAAEVGARVDAP